jgi:hypothetical protein
MSASTPHTLTAAAVATRERLLLAAAAALMLLAVLLPPLPQWPDFHDFADRRMLAGIPYAMDVLSNLPFLLFGVWGLWRLGRQPRAGSPRDAMWRRCAAVFFAALAATAAGSAWYHLAPNDDGLLVDRACIVVAFAAVLALQAAERVSARAAAATLAAVLAAGLASLAWWRLHDDLRGYGVLQFGGMALVCVLALLRPHGDTPRVQWGWLIAAHAVAKLFELGDHAVFAWTHQLISGHTLKHLLAALAAWPVLAALRAKD